MSWLRLTIETPADRVDPLAELLERFEAGSVSYQPVSDEALFDNNEDTEPQLWLRTSVVALLDPETDLDILLACIRNRIGTENILSHRIEYLQDRDWTQAYKSGFKKMVFADRLVIIPGWEENTTPDKPALVMEPGLAFGTGTHPTTRLCLEWLSTHDITGKTLIDYGCGSGILALAALRLGADDVFAVDNDPQAILATRHNAGRNGLLNRIKIYGPENARLPVADVLVANILYNPLTELAGVFKDRVRPGGTIVLSGILAGQVEDCLDTYRQWFKMEIPVHQDEWSLLCGHRL